MKFDSIQLQYKIIYVPWMIEKSTLLHFSVYMVKASAKQFDGAVGLLQS